MVLCNCHPPSCLISSVADLCIMNRVKFSFSSDIHSWNVCNFLSGPNVRTSGSLNLMATTRVLTPTSPIGQVFSSTVTGANERLWQRKKRKDKRRIKGKTGIQSLSPEYQTDGIGNVMFLSWLWQFNSFLWGIGFLSEVGESVTGAGMPLVGERKERKEKSCGNFSHSY